jgi:hypothetical protein
MGSVTVSGYYSWRVVLLTESGSVLRTVFCEREMFIYSGLSEREVGISNFVPVAKSKLIYRCLLDERDVKNLSQAGREEPISLYIIIHET